MEKGENNLNFNNLKPNISKENKNKKIVILSILIIILIILITIFLIYFFTREIEIKISENIENISLLEKGKVIQINQNKDLNLSDIKKIRFLFIDSSGKEYFYETNKISYNYTINSNLTGLNNFNNIKEIYAIFTYVNGTIIELPPKTTTTGTNISSGTSPGGGNGNGDGNDNDCTPDCAGKNCGDNGCSGSCGTCNENQTCESGVCEEILECTANSDCIIKNN